MADGVENNSGATRRSGPAWGFEGIRARAGAPWSERVALASGFARSTRMFAGGCRSEAAIAVVAMRYQRGGLILWSGGDSEWPIYVSDAVLLAVAVVVSAFWVVLGPGCHASAAGNSESNGRCRASSCRMAVCAVFRNR